MNIPYLIAHFSTNEIFDHEPVATLKTQRWDQDERLTATWNLPLDIFYIFTTHRLRLFSPPVSGKDGNLLIVKNKMGVIKNFIALYRLKE